MTYIFPYHQVPRGARVVLYGAGRVGADFKQQVLSGSDYTLISVVDQDYEILDVGSPESVAEMDFDYIVIAIESREVSSKVRDYILGLGISEDKLIMPEKLAFFPRYTGTLEIFLKNVKKDISEFIRQDSESLKKYYKGIICEIEDNHDKEILKPKLLEALDTLEEPGHQIVMLNIMLSAGIFDKELMQRLIHCQMALKNDTDTKYLQAILNTSIPQFYRQWIYDDYYLDVKKLFKQVCEEYGLQMEPVIKQRTDILKICIVCEKFVADRLYAPTQFVCQFANELVKQDCNVCIIPADATYFERAALLYGNGDFMSQSSLYQKGNYKVLDSRIEVRYIKSDTIKAKLQNLISSISSYSPDIILDFNDDLCPAGYMYSQHIPTLLVPVKETIASAWHTKVLTRAHKKALDDNMRFRTLRDENIIEFPTYIEEPEPSKPFHRSNHGFDLGDTILFSVGFRLSYEINNEFADVICSMINNNPNLKWILVGDNASPYMKENYSKLFEKKKIIEWGFEENLPGLYGMCDIYLNPDRLGGGFTVAMALKFGIPVVTMNNSEGAIIYTYDKVPLCENYLQLKDYILRLALEKDYYTHISRETKALADSYNIQNSISVIIKEMKNMVLEWDNKEGTNEKNNNAGRELLSANSH